MTVMTFLRNNSIAVDPSFFLSQLGSLISKEKGEAFVVNRSHDAPEVLQHILNVILQCSALPTNLVNISLVNSTSCTQCDCASVIEDNHTILRVVAASSVQQALMQLQQTSMLEGESMWHGPSCNDKREAIRSTRFASLPSILIIHIERFTHILPS